MATSIHVLPIVHVYGSQFVLKWSVWIGEPTHSRWGDASSFLKFSEWPHSSYTNSKKKWPPTAEEQRSSGSANTIYNNSEYALIDAHTLVRWTIWIHNHKNGYLCKLPQNLCSQVPNQLLKLCKCKTKKERSTAAARPGMTKQLTNLHLPECTHRQCVG